MRLYLEGHNVRLGHAISFEWSAEDIRAAEAAGDFRACVPVRYRASIHHARRLVERYNRRFGAAPYDPAAFLARNAQRLRAFIPGA